MLNKHSLKVISLRLSIIILGAFALSFYFFNATNSSIIFYFTIQSNLLVFGFYVVSFIHTYKSHRQSSIDWDYAPQFRGFITLMITVTGVVFSVILAPILSRLPAEDLGDFAVSPSFWKTICSLILHYYIPAAVIADWFLFSKKGQFTFKTTLRWFIYPLLYIIMVYIRAPFVDNDFTKYLYPFFNPSVMGIWLVPFILLMWLFFSGVAYLYVFLDQKLK